jgi:tetratricopeptide (TPR) repeat protein
LPVGGAVMQSPKIERYLQMVAAYPDSPLPRFSLGNAYFEDRQLEKAIEEYKRCLEAQPDWAACLIALGDAYAALGEREAAADALRRARTHAFRQGHATMANEAQEKLEELGFED